MMNENEELQTEQRFVVFHVTCAPVNATTNTLTIASRQL